MFRAGRRVLLPAASFLRFWQDDFEQNSGSLLEGAFEFG
jgi:hypothetical protein